MIIAFPAGVGVDEDDEALPVERDEGDDAGIEVDGEKDLVHRSGMGADVAVVPAAEHSGRILGGEALTQAFGSRAGFGGEVDMGVPVFDRGREGRAANVEQGYL